MQRNGCLPRRRRIAHITLGLDTGGQEKLLLEFARHADRRRFELFFLSLTTRGKVSADLQDCGWPVVALEEPPGFRPSIALHVLPWLRKWGIDVVHTHDSKPLIYGAPAARMGGAERVVHTRHFARLAQFTGRQTWLAKVASMLVDDFVCVSQESARAAVEEGVPARRVRTIWNGIDLTRFAYVGPNANGPAVLVARLSPEKDVATLLKAVPLVLRAQPQFRLEIAGNGPCMPQLRELANELGIESKVAFLGEWRDVAGLLARARLFVLPSLSEGVSLTLLEAMARGLPVVTTRVGGNPEVVVDGKTGRLVAPGDPHVLAQAILEVLGNYQASQEQGRAGRKRVEQHFAAQRMIADYEALYGARSAVRMAEAPAG